MNYMTRKTWSGDTRLREDKAELHLTEGIQAEIQMRGSENVELGREN
jgi:hypothetical protein